jgi:hypothetical protein
MASPIFGKLKAIVAEHFVVDPPTGTQLTGGLIEVIEKDVFNGLALILREVRDNGETFYVDRHDLDNLEKQHHGASTKFDIGEPVPFSALADVQKEMHREWTRRVIEILKTMIQ